MPSPLRRITTSVPVEVHDFLKAAAADKYMPLSAYVRALLIQQSAKPMAAAPATPVEVAPVVNDEIEEILAKVRMPGAVDPGTPSSGSLTDGWEEFEE